MELIQQLIRLREIEFRWSINTEPITRCKLPIITSYRMMCKKKWK